MLLESFISRKAFAVFTVAVAATAIGVTAGLLSGSGWKAFTVHGVSMEPHYYQGDLIITSSLENRALEPGSIIVFTADWASARHDNRVVHRVTALGSINGVPYAYTRGDNNSVDDPYPVNLAADDVQVVRLSVANGAHWLERLTTPRMLALTVAGAAFLVLGGAAFFGVPGFGTGRRRQPGQALSLNVPVKPEPPRSA